MSLMTLPINQVRLTNVAYVRLVKKGKRFEIACYRNKVVNWRNKIEEDINEVLQVASVFTNVSKGNLASGRDLMDAFGTSDAIAVCKEILEKGDLQVSEQERQALLESTFRDVAAIVCDLTVNPDSGRPYTIAMIQNAMKQIHFSANLTKSAKQQALEVIRKLKTVMNIARASMSLRIVCHNSDISAVLKYLADESKYISLLKSPSDSAVSVSPPAPGDAVAPEGLVASTTSSVEAVFEVRADPEAYKKMEEFIRSLTKGLGRVEVLQLRAAHATGPNDSSATSAAVASQSDLAVEEDTSEDEEQSESLVAGLASESTRHATTTRHPEGSDESDQDVTNYMGKMAVSKSALKKKTKQKNKSKQVVAEIPPAAAAPEVTVTVLPEPPLTLNGPNAVAVAVADVDNALPGGKKCNTCGGSFDDAGYRAHFRCDWHRYNLRRKMKTLPVVTESEYALLSTAEKNLTVDDR